MTDEVAKYIDLYLGGSAKADPEPVANNQTSFDVGSYVESVVNEEEAMRTGIAREVLGGLTFQAADELEALMASRQNGTPYLREKDRIRREREEFAKYNPGLAFASEAAGGVLTLGGAAAGLAKLGLKSVPLQGAVEGTVYGGFSGDSLEERAVNSLIGGFSGLAVGKLIDVAVTPSSAGGLRTEVDDLLDEQIAKNSPELDDRIAKAQAEEVFEEVDNPAYRATPIGESKTFGELWTNLGGAVRKFYSEKVAGTSDNLWANVGAMVGAKYQRADQAALATITKDLDALSKLMTPVIEVINKSAEVKGALLDYAAGKLGKSRGESLNKLDELLSKELTSEQRGYLRQYLDYSHAKNTELNKNIFGANFKEYLTYLHTRNSKYRQQLKDEGLSEAEIEQRMFTDRGFEKRTRGEFSKGEVDPNDYDNPILSDMARLFQMERMSQLHRIFGVDINAYKQIRKARLEDEAKTAASVVLDTGEVATDPLLYQRGLDAAKKSLDDPLTPDEFMDAFKETLKKKGISEEGSEYAKQRIIDTIMGQDKAPHPLVQILSSLAYATTLAGPMSAILNIADIPLLGAKYGGRAALEGMNVLNPFKKIDKVDLKSIGVSNQTMGEFVNSFNGMANKPRGFLEKTAKAMRESTDFLMKGSLFQAMDQVGKQGVMRGVLKSAVDDAGAGKLADNWGFYFNKAELDIIEDQLKRHGLEWGNYTGKGKDLVEELMAAGLGQQQLISAAGRSGAWARNPNLRPLWALRGFVVKQQALLLREVVGNLKAGRGDKAAQFLGRYAAYGAGGYAIINEGRQAIFGDGNVSASGVARGYGDAWASLLTANTLGLNDYQFGQIQRIGVLPTLALGMAPIAVTRPFDIAGKAIDVIDQERPPQALLSEAFPIYKQSARAGRNISGMLGEGGYESMFSEAIRQRND